ncbi:MAG: hypothetical protein LHW44_07125 [Candidatus Cloacimonetes bacterium]|nr:hypothetical protein [Candidatus Cloacimonadota bacterium]
MKKRTFGLDSQLLKKIERLIYPCFSLIESSLLNNTKNQFSCFVSELSGNDFKAKMDSHFAGSLSQGGIYLFRIKTSESFNVTDFKADWDNSKHSIVGKRPKSNTNHNGQCIDHEQTPSNEYFLYVGSSLKVGSRIKEHFRGCVTAKSTTSLRLRCSSCKYLKDVTEIKVNYIFFDGLRDANNKEMPIHNLCRYFESKMRHKYQTLIGE